MLELGSDFQEHDLVKSPPSADELETLIGPRNYVEFLNPKHELYRKLRMKEKPPSRAEAAKLMAKEPNLIRRPRVIRGQQLVLGHDEEALKKLIR